jgi:hypothetical protein
VSVKDVPDHLAVRNSESLAEWRWRWHLQGGSGLFHARSLRDLRNDEDLKRWRVIEFQVRATGRAIRKRKVVSLAAWRIERAKRTSMARIGARA